MSGDRSVLEAALTMAAHHVEPALLARLVATGPGATATAAAAALAKQGRTALPVLRGMLCAPQPRLVALGAELLGQIAEPTTAALLRPLLDHVEPDVVRAAARSLGRMRDARAVPRLIALLEGEPRTWLAAIDALGAIGDVAAVLPLARWIAEPTLSAAVARALGRIGDRAALPTLIRQVISGPATGARIAAMVAIADILRDQTVARREFARLRGALDRSDGLPSFLADVLGSTDREVSRAAARLVLAAGLTRWLPHVLLRATGRDDLAWTAAECARWADRLTAGIAVALDSRDPELLRALMICAPVHDAAVERLAVLARARIDDGDPRIRVAACVALGRLGVISAAPALAARLRDGGPLDQTAAAEALARLGAEAREALTICLDGDVGPAALIAALRVLAAIGLGRFAARVETLLSDGRARVRGAALQAIAASDDAEVAARLVVAIHDPDLEVARLAIELLVARAERRALPHLLRLIRTSPMLRPFAMPALGRLGDAATAAELIAELGEPALTDLPAVAAAIAAIDAPCAVLAIRSWLDGDQPELRRLAVAALARRAGAADRSLIDELALDVDATVRYHAAWALGRLDCNAGRKP